ncbi:MAG: hypothetical protein ACD_62C00395G0013 [uncultured bacterium]|nr:MAG: hypothetical protein ACD_62C00395G0013 [uncultured bacterium]
MPHRKLDIIVFALGALLLLTHCSSTVTRFNSESDDSPGSTTEIVVGGNISTVTLDGETTSVTVDDVSSSDNIILMLFAQKDTSSSSGFEVGGSLNDALLVKNSVGKYPVLADPVDISGDLRDVLTEFENQLEPDALLSQSVSSSSLQSVKLASTGSQRSFKVLNSFSNSSSYDTVTATLRYQTVNFAFYVDNRNASALDDVDLENLGEYFDDIIPVERDMFGEESDINGDGQFAVLFSQTVNELGGSAGGMVTGFYYAADQFDSSQYAISNEMEIFYTFVPDPSGTSGVAISKSFALSNIYPGVLPHEFQHMINFNQHYNINGGAVEVSWLNEALSHLAEDLYSLDDGDYMTAAGLENPSRISGYLEDVANLCFTCGTGLYERGGGYLFLRYLYEQAQKGNFPGVADGMTLLGNLLNTNVTGIENIVQAVYGSSATQEQFKDLLGLFGLAVYLSDTGASSDTRFNFEGIDLRGTQDDNRGTVLNGPAVMVIDSFPFSDTIMGSSLYYIQMTGADILAQDSAFDLTVSSSADFGAYMIRE